MFSFVYLLYMNWKIPFLCLFFLFCTGCTMIHNTSIIKKIQIKYGGVDKENPRIEAELKDL